MKVSIHNDSQLYIRMKDGNVHNFKKSLAEIKCKLLYDVNDNFLGMKILSQRSATGENVELPEIGPVEFPLFSSEIKQDIDGIYILFDKDVTIHKELVDECILDLCADGIIGIEPMPYMHIGGRSIIEPFIMGVSPEIDSQ